MLAKKKRKELRDAIHSHFPSSDSPSEYLRKSHRFDEAVFHNRFRTHVLTPPADKYQSPTILTRLSELPECHQPSLGWKWFCESHKVPSFGIGPTAHQLWRRVWKHGSTKKELGAGFPFWDSNKLQEWKANRGPSLVEKNSGSGLDPHGMDAEQAEEVVSLLGMQLD
jgi:hypothetical protein